MEILLLGTAAAEGIPAAWCDCSVCAEARRRGGPNIRARSGALIDDDLKIDYGPDTIVHMQHARRSLAKVQAVLVTHNHPDHLYAVDLKRAYPPSTNTCGDRPLAIYGPESVLAEVRRSPIPEPVKRQLALNLLQPLSATQTAMGDVVLPLPAKHAPDSLIFRITRKGKTLLYGHDTGLYLPETLSALADGVVLDVALMDCTLSGQHGAANQHHLNIKGMLQMVQEMRQRGAIRDHTRIIITHFSHNGLMLHEELVTAMAPHGIEVAYDGMRIII